MYMYKGKGDYKCQKNIMFYLGNTDTCSEQINKVLAHLWPLRNLISGLTYRRVELAYTLLWYNFHNSHQLLS